MSSLLKENEKDPHGIPGWTWEWNERCGQGARTSRKRLECVRFTAAFRTQSSLKDQAIAVLRHAHSKRWRDMTGAVCHRLSRFPENA